MPAQFNSRRYRSFSYKLSGTLAGALSGAFLGLLMMSAPMAVLAHKGHGNEFQGGAEATSADSIEVDAETAQRIGLKVEPVGLRRLAFGVTDL